MVYSHENIFFKEIITYDIHKKVVFTREVYDHWLHKKYKKEKKREIKTKKKEKKQKWNFTLPMNQWIHPQFITGNDLIQDHEVSVRVTFHWKFFEKGNWEEVEEKKTLIMEKRKQKMNLIAHVSLDSVIDDKKPK